jgi:hypothetical protein
MGISAELRRLIEANAPLWAGEAEVVRTYWTSPVRTREADRLWLKRQAWKEYAGIADSEGKTVAMVSDLEAKLSRWVPRLDVDVDRHEVEELLEKVAAEFRHYCLFADIYDALREPGEPKLNPNEDLAPWPEEAELAAVRRAVNKSHAKLGWRATEFTEGGYCTMYSEGAALQGKPGLDGQIGRACQRVFDDEFGHMMHGIVGVDDVGLTKGDWAELTEMTMEQLRLRIHMRNAQFSHPLSDARVAEIVAGRIEPIRFDYARAESFLNEAHGVAAE